MWANISFMYFKIYRYHTSLYETLTQKDQFNMEN